MDNLKKLTSESLDKYFNTLSSIGYLNNNKVNNIILLVGLQELLERFQEFITAEDYNKIDKIITCLMGKSCLVSYDKFMLASNPVKWY